MTKQDHYQLYIGVNQKITLIMDILNDLEQTLRQSNFCTFVDANDISPMDRLRRVVNELSQIDTSRLPDSACVNISESLVAAKDAMSEIFND